MMMPRAHEWVLLAYFWYTAAIAPFFLAEPGRAVWLALAVTAFLGLASRFNYGRDWAPLILILTAYREMDWFVPRHRDYHLELGWIEWDRTLFYRWGFQSLVEALGPLVPAFLEFTYLLVYAIGPFVVAALYLTNHRRRIGVVLTVFLLGTMLSYALFPYFPSVPPRALFGASDLPHYVSPFRRLNLYLVNGYGIHSSVFPSAHVSSAFSGAWALMLFVPEEKWLGRGMLFYAISVAIAVVYGRYHYAVDSLSGFGISLIALGVGFAMKSAGILEDHRMRVRQRVGAFRADDNSAVQ